jgi:hypothetical protein
MWRRCAVAGEGLMAAENLEKGRENNRLMRWSERKLAADADAGADAAAETAALPTEAGADAAEAPVVAPEDLPDIDSLDAESDFSVFMREGVPEELKNLALRKLWRSDPVYANLDGLNDYDPDHTSFLVQAAETAKEMLEKALKDDGRDDAAPKAEAEADSATASGDVAEASDAPERAVADGDAKEDAESVTDGDGREMPQ